MSAHFYSMGHSESQSVPGAHEGFSDGPSDSVPGVKPYEQGHLGDDCLGNTKFADHNESWAAQFECSFEEPSKPSRESNDESEAADRGIVAAEEIFHDDIAAKGKRRLTQLAARDAERRKAQLAAKAARDEKAETDREAAEREATRLREKKQVESAERKRQQELAAQEAKDARERKMKAKLEAAERAKTRRRFAQQAENTERRRQQQQQRGTNKPERPWWEREPGKQENQSKEKYSKKKSPKETPSKETPSTSTIS